MRHCAQHKLQSGRHVECTRPCYNPHSRGHPVWPRLEIGMFASRTCSASGDEVGFGDDSSAACSDQSLAAPGSRDVDDEPSSASRLHKQGLLPRICGGRIRITSRQEFGPNSGPDPGHPIPCTHLGIKRAERCTSGTHRELLQALIVLHSLREDQTTGKASCAADVPLRSAHTKCASYCEAATRNTTTRSAGVGLYLLAGTPLTLGQNLNL